MRLETDLIKSLPYWYREILDYQQLCLTESEQFEGLAFALNNTGDNFFFQTADAGAISLWEQVLHIIPNLTTETLEFRRSRVISRICTKPPFTLGFLYRKLDELIGPGLWKVFVDYPNYSLYIESSAKNQNYYQELLYTIGKIKPAHIIFINSPRVPASLELTETIFLAERTWNYHLARWPLGQDPFAYTVDKGVIKMADTPSIQPLMIDNTAEFIAGEIASARINGALTITAITKSVENNTVTIKYTVHPADAQSITKAELLNAKGEVLTASTVYVPVGVDTIMTHVITAKEGAAE